MATSTVIHFEGTYKEGRAGYTQKVPHCTRFAMHISYGQTTTDKALVNCTRCAKQLGFTPAAKKVSSTIGTCQCCFGGYETRQKGGKGDFKSVLHGYTRPGHGYIVGDCRGCGFVPFEVSCEQTKVFRAELVGILAHRNEALSNLENGLVAVLYAEVSTGKRVPHSNPKYSRSGMTETEYKRVEVKLGDEMSQNPFQPECPWERVPAYATLQARRISEVKREIAAITSDITFLSSKIDGWVAAPFPKA